MVSICFAIAREHEDVEEVIVMVEDGYDEEVMRGSRA